MTRLNKWEYKEHPTQKGKLYEWTNLENPDLKVIVMQSSIIIGPGTITYVMPGAPSHKKHYGWFVFFEKWGEFKSILGGSISRHDAKRGYITKQGKGPWTHFQAMLIARNFIANPHLYAQHLTPREANMQIPGWRLERRNDAMRTFLWVSENNGRHQLLLTDIFRTNDWHLLYRVGYADDPKELKKTMDIGSFKGWTNAISKVREAASKMQIPKGQIEKLFEPGGAMDKLAYAIKNVPDKELAKITDKMKSGKIDVKDAIQQVYKKQDVKKEIQNLIEGGDNGDRPK